MIFCRFKFLNIYRFTNALKEEVFKFTNLAGVILVNDYYRSIKELVTFVRVFSQKVKKSRKKMKQILMQKKSQIKYENKIQ